jgi:hypothetical protein
MDMNHDCKKIATKFDLPSSSLSLEGMEGNHVVVVLAAAADAYICMQSSRRAYPNGNAKLSKSVHVGFTPIGSEWIRLTHRYFSISHES